MSIKTFVYELRRLKVTPERNIPVVLLFWLDKGLFFIYFSDLFFCILIFEKNLTIWSVELEQDLLFMTLIKFIIFESNLNRIIVYFCLYQYFNNDPNLNNWSLYSTFRLYTVLWSQRVSRSLILRLKQQLNFVVRNNSCLLQLIYYFNQKYATSFPSSFP